MRHRRWVLLLAAILIAVVPLGLLGLRAASRHPAFRRSVAERLMPDAKGRLSIGELEIGLASIRVSDVRIDLERGGFVEIPQATVGVSYRKLLASGFRLGGSLGTAVVTDPRVVIVRESGSGGGTPPGPPLDLAPMLESLPDHVSVSNASVTFVDRSAGWSFGAVSVDLVAERCRNGRIEADASGDCFGGRENLTGSFAWDRPSGTLSFTAHVSDGDITDGFPLVPGVSVRALSGRVAATLVGTVESGSEAVWSVAFDLGGASLEAADLGERVEGVSVRGSLDGRVLRIEDASGTWRSSYLRGGGSISLVEQSFHEVHLSASGVDLDALAAIALPDAIVAGRADVDLTLEGPFSGPTAEVSVTRGRLESAFVSFSDCAAEGRFAPGRIEVDRFDGSTAGGSL